MYLLCDLLDFRVGLGEERQEAVATELLALACVQYSGGRGVEALSKFQRFLCEFVLGRFQRGWVFTARNGF